VGGGAKEDLLGKRDVCAIAASEAKEEARDASEFIVEDADITEGEGGDAE
jgi:hypothetical protein